MANEITESTMQKALSFAYDKAIKLTLGMGKLCNNTFKAT